MKRNELSVIHEHDLEQYLSGLGLLEAIKSEQLNCEYCKVKINIDNFQCVFSLNKEIKVCCNKAVCYQQALNLFAEKEL
jgi:hypothetical protein